MVEAEIGFFAELLDQFPAHAGKLKVVPSILFRSAGTESGELTIDNRYPGKSLLSLQAQRVITRPNLSAFAGSPSVRSNRMNS